MTTERWDILGSKYLIQDKWLTIRADTCRTPEGLIVDPYYVHESEDWINIVAFDAEDRILLVEQYRHGIADFTVELPAGCMEPGEAPEVAVRRELLEETGCVVETLTSLPPMYPNPPRMNNRVYPFYATGAKIEHSQKLDVTEKISFSFVELPKVLEMIDNGRFSHAIHVANVLMALRWRAK